MSFRKIVSYSTVILSVAVALSSASPTHAKATNPKINNLTNTLKTEKVLISQWQAELGKWVWQAGLGWVFEKAVEEGVRGPMQNPRGQDLGPLSHAVYWEFCSGQGYQSYYNLGGDNLLCGRNPYVEGQPEGDPHPFANVCAQYYGRASNYDSSSGMCYESN
jgi:hypothetical protein